MKQDLPAVGLILSDFLPFLFPNFSWAWTFYVFHRFKRKG